MVVATTHNLEMHKGQQKVQFQYKHILCSHDSKSHYEVDFSTIHNHFLKTNILLKPRAQKNQILHLTILGNQSESKNYYSIQNSKDIIQQFNKGGNM